MRIEMPKAIFFDWDGTLVDSLSFIHAAHNFARTKLNMPEFDKLEFEPYFGKPRDEIYLEIYGDRGNLARSYFEEYIADYYSTELKEMPGAADLLNTTQELGLVAGVVSNKRGDFIRREITNFGWDSYFSSIIGAGDADQDKPSAEPLIKGINEAGIAEISNDIWYVGDTEIDLACAENAGCPSIFITNQQENQVYDSKYKPLVVVKNCSDLQQLLLQCAEK